MWAGFDVLLRSLLQGIYRVSGVKSRVENLCQQFETNANQVDLSEHHPNVVSNVLKLYLRQVGACVWQQECRQQNAVLL